MARKEGGAAAVPPNAPCPQLPRCTGGPGQSWPGCLLSEKTSEETAKLLAPPTKATDWLVCVVPVFPMPGRVQPADLADAAVVPIVGSWLNPANSESASPAGTTCSQAWLRTGTGWPFRSGSARVGV